MNRKAWVVFVVVQVFGEVGPWAGLHMKSAVGPALWVAGMVLMMPGRLLALFITEKLLWGVRITPAQMTAVFVVIEVAANLLVWLLCAKLLRSLRRRRLGKPIPTTSL
jgi:hypothetical protein